MALVEEGAAGCLGEEETFNLELCLLLRETPRDPQCFMDFQSGVLSSSQH